MGKSRTAMQSIGPQTKSFADAHHALNWEWLQLFIGVTTKKPEGSKKN